MKIEKLNRVYEEKAVGVFPFISKHRVTPLEAGYYTKDKSNYRGLTYQYDKIHGINKTLLIGYYFVPKDYIIVPKGMIVTEGKQKIIDSYIERGFNLVNKFPSLKPIQFEEETEEYAAAFAAYTQYKNK
jgi:hypothetical protein